MAIQDRKNHITIAKAIGILLMVAGHSGIPLKMFNDFIYVFHMPLFFFCSGYFFKEQTNLDELRQFFRKRVFGLYLPYLKWCFLFLILHNLFYHLHLYNRSYVLSDYLENSVKILTMAEYETLLRPFWFLKALFISLLCIGLLSYFSNIYKFCNINIKMLLMVLLLTISSKFMDFQIPLIGDPSVILFGILYIISGLIYRKYKKKIYMNSFVFILFFLLILIGNHCFLDNIDMRYTNIYNTIPYYILSIMGIILVIEVSTKLNSCKSFIFIKLLYYIGNNTMPILALHLLALKIGNYVKIQMYNLPIDRLGEHTVITDFNDCFWIFYIFLGILCPLLVYYLFNKIMTILKQKAKRDI